MGPGWPPHDRSGSRNLKRAGSCRDDHASVQIKVSPFSSRYCTLVHLILGRLRGRASPCGPVSSNHGSATITAGVTRQALQGWLSTNLTCGGTAPGCNVTKVVWMGSDGNAINAAAF